MPAGPNCAINIIRFLYTDDDVGGAMVTGTVLHSNLAARISDDFPDYVDKLDSTYNGRGYETRKVFSGMIWGHNLQVLEQDQVEVISPPNHIYYGKKFRIVQTSYDNRHPGIKQNYLLVKLERNQISHTEAFQ